MNVLMVIETWHHRRYLLWAWLFSPLDLNCFFRKKSVWPRHR